MKTMGYPLFLAVVSWFSRGVNIEFIKYTQIILDVCAGILVWLSTRKVFTQKIADLAFVMYMMNPLTSAYVGILLPEILTCFLASLLLFLSARDSVKTQIFIWFFIGFVSGLLLFTKPGMLFISLGLIVVMAFVSFKRKDTWKFLVTSIIGFMIASSYTLTINSTQYGKITLTPPYSTIGGQMYVMLFYADRYPEVEFWGVVPELTQIYQEYGSLPDSQIPQWNKHYLNLLFLKLMHEPFTFLSHYVKNFFWLWDKDHLSVYIDPWYPADRYILRIVNLTFMGIGMFGFVRYVRSGLKAAREPFVILTLMFAGVMSFWFPTVSNESRHTIPFYPLLFFWAAPGIDEIINRIKRNLPTRI